MNDIIKRFKNELKDVEEDIWICIAIAWSSTILGIIIGVFFV